MDLWYNVSCYVFLITNVLPNGVTVVAVVQVFFNGNFYATLIGLAAGLGIGMITERYTGLEQDQLNLSLLQVQLQILLQA